MRRQASGLGFKLNLALLLFLVVLGTATAWIIAYGFNRTRVNALQRSQEGLEELGRQSMLAIAGGQSDIGSFQMEWAAEVGQRAGRYMEQSKQQFGQPVVDASILVRGREGILYNPDPERASDLAMPNYAEVTAAALDDIAYTQALDAYVPAIFGSFPGALRDENFDPIAFSIATVNNVFRYYPPVGVHETADPATDPSRLLGLLGPEQNQNRKTLWTTPYEDAAGQGLVMSAATPVYEGDVYRGVIEVDLSLDLLVEQVNIVKPTPGGFSFYVDNEGELLPTDSYALLNGELTAGDNPEFASLFAEIKALAENGIERGGTVRKVRLDDEEYFIAYVPFIGVGGAFAVAAPVAEITAQAAGITESIDREAGRTVASTIGLMGIIFLIGLALAGWLNRRVLLRPIEAMVRGTQAVAAGDLYAEIEVHGKDEMAILARSFNEMTADIRARQESLELEIRERRQAQDELRALFSSMTDIVLVIDREGRFVRVPRTSAPARLLPQDELQGLTMHEVMPASQADAFLAIIQEALDTRQTSTIEYPLDIEDGVYWFSAAVSPMAADQVVVVAREITDRVQARLELERRVEERTRELTSLLQVSRNVASTLDLRRLLRLIIDEVKQIADYSRCSIMVVEGDAMVLLDSRSMTSEVEISWRIPLGDIEPICERLRAREPVLIDDVRGDSALARAYQRGAGSLFETAFRDIHSWMGVPLEVNERLIGMLTLSHDEPGFFTSDHARLVTAVATQIAIAIENARLYERAQQLAAVEERQRLARELHDSVSQALYGIALGACTARTLLDRNPESATEPMDYVLSLAEAGLAEMRALIFELRPESLEMEGLVSALQKQISATAARYSIEVEADLGEEPSLPLGDKEVFYRIGQEALHNVVKHARANRVSVRLSAHNGSVDLEVRDDGVGFDDTQAFPGHMGLVSMAERAHGIGADLAIASRPGQGTTVRLTSHRRQ